MKTMGYEFDIFDAEKLNNTENFAKLDILFINCVGPSPSSSSIENVHNFVAKGGTFYASCYADKWIQAIFPEYLQFHHDGFVIFTTFHNSVQTSEMEKRLLEYLVLSPLMYKTVMKSKHILQGSQFKQTNEYLGALSVSQESSLYEFLLNKVCDLRFIFNWEGKAVSRIWIFDPDGQLVKEENTRIAPHLIDIPKAKVGVWTFKMKIVDAPLKKFPFTINVGVKDALQKKIPPASPPKSPPISPSRTTPNSPSQNTPNRLKVPHIKFEILSPVRQMLTKTLRMKEKSILGRVDLPTSVPGRNTVSSKHCEITVLDSRQIQIKDLSSNGTGASHYESGPFKTQILQKNTSTTLELPVIIQLSASIIIGLYF
ncbi:MAG: hypothetical protein ACTSYI_06335 [Promethearchaeota archaeon]